MLVLSRQLRLFTVIILLILGGCAKDVTQGNEYLSDSDKEKLAAKILKDDLFRKYMDSSREYLSKITKLTSDAARTAPTAVKELQQAIGDPEKFKVVIDKYKLADQGIQESMNKSFELLKAIKNKYKKLNLIKEEERKDFLTKLSLDYMKAKNNSTPSK